MASSTSARVKSLDAIYRFSDDSFPGGAASWNSHLRPATGVKDGERYLVRLFRKTGTTLDSDLRHLLDRGLRRIRRVLTSRRARDVLVEVIDVVEDDNEIGVAMLRSGDPLSGSTYRTRARLQQLLTGTGRQVFWRNMLRITEGLTLCHDAGIVHGAISLHTIFSHSDDVPDYRLGGYESCVQILDDDPSSVRDTLRNTGVVSFRHDWIDLGKAARAILGMDGTAPPPLSSIEFKMLDRLTNPPNFQLFDGRTVIREIKDVIEEVDRVGSGGEGELILYPGRQAMQSDFASLTSGTIPAADTDRILRFVADDLLGPEILAVAMANGSIKLVTDLATYNVRVEAGRIGSITGAWKRRPDDRVTDAFEIKQRIHLATNRAGAEERSQRAGLGVIGWVEIAKKKTSLGARDEPPSWFALVLLEAFSLLREQFRIYPVKAVSAPDAASKDLVWVTLRNDEERDAKRKRAGLRPCAEALRHELSHDEGRPDWTVSASDALAGMREKVPELSFEGAEDTDGHRLYGFSSSEPVVPGQSLYLRPRKDVGLEQAVRRRLQNLVAAKANAELLRAIDDPAQVAIDDVLVEIAAPGQPPKDLDGSKTTAWNSIASGKSISVVVGPPGVGKTYLISELIKSIHSHASRSRILVSAQNHETLVNMEQELKGALPEGVAIVVRVERANNGGEKGSLRTGSATVLGRVKRTADLAIMTPQFQQIEQALYPTGPGQAAVAERVLRDTDTLLLRSSNVTLATTSSHVIEEMISDGEQFDWVFVEEAARANGSELVGALLLGNRRVIIGDHNQLSPFDALERKKFYNADRAELLLEDARRQLGTFSDLPPEVDQALEILENDKSLRIDVLGLATRFEEPFRSIAEREEERVRTSGSSSSIANTLLEQSRMHPAICQLVSNTFYNGLLQSAKRVVDRKPTLRITNNLPSSPILVLNLPSLSMVNIRAFEDNNKGSYRNLTECKALIQAVKSVQPQRDDKGHLPTLVFLAPYWAQVRQLERLLNHLIDNDGTLFGFVSPRDDRRFVYTSDSFQGGEADLVAASLVRNNTQVGRRALGHVRSPQRMNVLLSRARQKLILATSLGFLGDAVDGTDPDHLGGELGFLRKMIDEVNVLTKSVFGSAPGASIIPVDVSGKLCP